MQDLGPSGRSALGGLLASLGSLTGATLAVVPPLFAACSVVVVALWFKKCHPRPIRWLREIKAGAGLGAALQAILVLVGVTAPQLRNVHLCLDYISSHKPPHPALGYSCDA